MPFYRITVQLKNGRIYRGVRQLDIRNIDVVDNLVKKRAKAYFGEVNISKVDVVMIPKNSLKK